MRFLLIGLGVIAALVVVLFATLSYKGDDIIRDASREAGRDVLGATVIVNDFEINPFSGSVSIKGFSVGQPSGFGDDESFSVEEFFIDLETKSLFSNHLKIETILIDKPVLNLVLQGDDSNFGRIQKNIERELGRANDNGEQNITLRDFYLNGTTLKIQSDQVGRHDVTLADIHLKDIGVEEGGVPPSELFRLAMDAIKPQVGKALLELGIKNQLTQEFDRRIGDKLDAELDKLPDPIKDVADKVKSGIGGLLKKKPKENENND